MEIKEIIERLPYQKPFLFVDGLSHIDQNGVECYYTITSERGLYKGDFKENPVTPGVILTETMAQIGVVCLGIYLLTDELQNTIAIALTSTEVEFLKPVYPEEKVTVLSEKVYFRFGKLKCKVVMKNNSGDEVARGTISGMIIKKP